MQTPTKEAFWLQLIVINMTERSISVSKYSCTEYDIAIAQVSVEYLHFHNELSIMANNLMFPSLAKWQSLATL